MTTINREDSSYRDHQSTVYISENRVFRKIKKNKKNDITTLLNSDFYKKNINKIIETNFLQNSEVEKLDFEDSKDLDSCFWLEHKKLETIIYPYEMSFSQLKDSAIFFLDLYLEALENNFDLVDATPYNVQFVKNKPIFIDITSFEIFKKDSYFFGYKQFCEQYLSPLLLQSYSNIDFNNLYMGNLNGIDLSIVSKILPLRSWLSYNCLINVHLHSYLNSKISSSSHKTKNLTKKKQISIHQKKLLLKNLKNFITKLKNNKKTYWSNYSKENSYNDDEIIFKKDLVKKFIKDLEIKNVIDIGCNNGVFSDAAISSGAEFSLGVDNDTGALDDAYEMAKKKSINFLPLYLNLLNPSPSIGWLNKERKKFLDRFSKKFDGVICLACIHHICVGNNVPVNQFIEYLSNFSKKILLEFVPKEDPMVSNMLSNKKDIYENYNLNFFTNEIKKTHKILWQKKILNTERVLYALIKND